jgi:hypothetical protein
MVLIARLRHPSVVLRVAKLFSEAKQFTAYPALIVLSSRFVKIMKPIAPLLRIDMALQIVGLHITVHAC